MAKKIKRQLGENGSLNCACLIHDTLYDFSYVDKLYRAICRNTSIDITMHVFTESNRPVPEPYVKHNLQEWSGIRGPKKSWWYKIQLFDPTQCDFPILYFDLDTVIVGNIDWIWRKNIDFFHAAQDFKYLFRSRRTTINSSVMWFDPRKWSHVYNDFDPRWVSDGVCRYHGDQDYIHQAINPERLCYLNPEKIKSYKWEVMEGGFDFAKRKQKLPGSGTIIEPDHSVYIFHGNPKPHQVSDREIHQHWR